MNGVTNPHIRFMLCTHVRGIKRIPTLGHELHTFDGDHSAFFKATFIILNYTITIDIIIYISKAVSIYCSQLSECSIWYYLFQKDTSLSHIRLWFWLTWLEANVHSTHLVFISVQDMAVAIRSQTKTTKAFTATSHQVSKPIVHAMF